MDLTYKCLKLLPKELLECYIPCRYLSLAAGGGARLLGVPEATRAARARAAAALALW